MILIKRFLSKCNSCFNLNSIPYSILWMFVLQGVLLLLIQKQLLSKCMIHFFCFNSLNVCLKLGFVVEVKRGEVWEDRAASRSLSLKDHMTNKQKLIWMLVLIGNGLSCRDMRKFWWVLIGFCKLPKLWSSLLCNIWKNKHWQNRFERNTNFLRTIFSLTRWQVYSTQASCFCLSSWVRVGKKLRNATNTEVFARSRQYNESHKC